MLTFKKYKRKPTYVDMAKVSDSELKELLSYFTKIRAKYPREISKGS